jgi:hypothetical protein
VRRAPISIRSGSRIAHSVSARFRAAWWRKKQRLAFARAEVDDAAHVGHEAHVEHPVGFVEHEMLTLSSFTCPVRDGRAAGPAWRRAHRCRP